MFFSLSAISLFHYVNSARLSSLGKRVQKYTLLVYNPNILNSFFEVFLKESAKALKDNDVVEHVFFIMSGLRAKTVHMGYIIISHASA